MDIWWNNVIIDEVRVLFVLCIDLPQGFNELDWIGFVKLDVWLDLFVLDWMNWIGLDWIELDCYLDVGYIGLIQYV